MPTPIETIDSFLKGVADQMDTMRENASQLASDLAAAVTYLRTVDPLEFLMSNADTLIESVLTRARDIKTELDAAQAENTKLKAESVVADTTTADAQKFLDDTAPAAPAPAPAPEPAPAPVPAV